MVARAPGTHAQPRATVCAKPLIRSTQPGSGTGWPTSSSRVWINLIKLRNASPSPSSLVQRHRESPSILEVRRSNGAPCVPACSLLFKSRHRTEALGSALELLRVRSVLSEPWEEKEGLLRGEPGSPGGNRYQQVSGKGEGERHLGGMCWAARARFVQLAPDLFTCVGN